MKIEIDNLNYCKPFVDTYEYSSLIIDEYNNLHLEDGENCYFEINNNKISIAFKPNQELNSEKVINAVRIIRKDKNLGKFFFPVKNIVQKDKYNIELTTWFKAPLLKNILQVPWLFQENKNIDEIDFIFNRSSDKRMDLLRSDFLDVTWPANGSSKEKNYKLKKYKYFNLPGNNIFTIRSSDTNFLNLIKNIKKEFEIEAIKKLNNQVDVVNSFLLNFDTFELERETYSLSELKKEYRLGYLNYYPNKEICYLLKEILKPYVEVTLCNLGFIEDKKWITTHTDGQLLILSPTFFSKYSIALGLLADFEINNKMDLLLDIYSLKGEKIAKQLMNSKHYLPILSSRNIFWQRSDYNSKVFDNYGRIKKNAFK
ncbi:hypothetical protein CBF69_09545 [Lactobacillus taiwanensis]|uniref:hypothetical protein n=1 Tax=Lactobacillus taiwanensis TaxID=508451 RepID=UPI000B98580B|nr:hypothetical protein [Lactobacillus taiwanensis]OYS12946.1 hypothetical protein CBF69_09545 [Lactobacillus taiwanensis]